MNFKNLKDGIYKIALTDKNPYCEFVIVKTYGDVRKERALPTLEDIEQQEQEWDADYGEITVNDRNQAVRTYKLYEYGALIGTGSAKDLSEKHGIVQKSLYKAAKLGNLLHGKYKVVPVEN